MNPWSVRGSSAKNVLHCNGRVEEFDGHFYTIKTPFGYYSRVPSLCGKCSIGDEVLVAFGDVKNRRHPLIVYNKSKIVSQSRRRNGIIILPTALWSQSLSSPGLNPFAPNCFRPDPAASTLTVWSGTGGNYNDFPVLLDKDVRPVLGFALRKFDNSNWDKVRVLVVTGISTAEVFECDWEHADTPLGWVGGFFATNSDGSLVFVSEANTKKCFRKRAGALQEITLADISPAHGPYFCNMSDFGQLVFPNWQKIYSGTLTYPDFPYPGSWPAGTPVWLDASTTSKIDYYNLDTDGTTLTRNQIEPASLFPGYFQPAVSSFGGSHAYDSQGRLLAWASARDSFNPANGGFEESACAGFRSNGFAQPRPSGGDYVFPNNGRQWGRKLAGVVACILNGATQWIHKIEHTAGAPLANSQLIDPFDAAFATQEANNGFVDANYASEIANPAAPPWRPNPITRYSTITYEGIAEQESLTSVVAIYSDWRANNVSNCFPASGSHGSTGVYTGFPPNDDPYAVVGFNQSSGEFSLPRFDHYHDVQIELLPRGRNLAQPILNLYGDTGKKNNWGVFADWSAPTDQTGSKVVCRRPEDSPYVSFTVPVSCFFGGQSTLQGRMTDGFQHGIPEWFALVEYSQNAGYQRLYINRAEESGGPYEIDTDWVSFPLLANIGAAGYNLGGPSGVITANVGAVKGHFIRDFSFLSKRFVRKIDSSGSLAWEKDLTQLMAGAEYWRSYLEAGLRGTDLNELVGARSTEELPLGDDMGAPVPAGRVCMLWADFHDLGPDFLPTQKLLILDDSDGNLLHTIDLTEGDEPEEILGEDVREPDIESPINESDFFTGDGTTTEFELSFSFVEWTYVQDHVGNFEPGDTIAFSFADGKIIYEEAPPDGAEISVYYISGYESTPGSLLWRAGEKRYDPTVVEIYAGVDPNDKEWALIQINRVDRLGESSGTRLLKLKMAANITTAPDQTWTTDSLQIGRLAIHGGSIYQLGSNGGGANSILKKTNPSTV